MINNIDNINNKADFSEKEFYISDDIIGIFTEYRISDRKLNFNDANKLTRELISKNTTKLDNRYASSFIILNDAIFTISSILNEIYVIFNSDKEITDLNLEHELIKINLSNLEIARRITDKSFYVGIIGEFSCGKSTFINALLEQRFLIEDVLAGTTCSKTVIRYAAKENIIVIFSNGSRQQMRKDGDGDLLDDAQKREFLREMTANENRAKDISEVIWESPIEVLNNGLCIVDTPGIGTDNNRHTDVAREAARDCDALLVLTNMEKPLSKELAETVKEIAGKPAGKCVFIGTRKDQFPPEELTRMHRYFNNRLNSQYGHNCQFEFVSAYRALKDLEERRCDGAGLVEFRKFRTKIRQLLESNRHKVQSINILELIGNINKDVTESFNAKKQDFDKKIIEYKQMVIPGDSKKWQDWDKEMLRNFSSKAQVVKKEAIKNAIELANLIRRVVKDKIKDCKETEELQEYLKKGFTKTVSSYSSQIKNFPVSQLQDPLIKIAYEVQKNHAQKFIDEYKKIQNILGSDIRISLQNTKQKINHAQSSANTKDLDDLNEDIDAEELVKVGGGMAAGIAVALLVPGVGWILGGIAVFLGAIFGVIFCRSLEDLKKEAYVKVEKSMASFEKNFLENIDENYKLLDENIKSKLKEYGQQQKQKYLHEMVLYNKALEIKTNHLEETKVFLDGKINKLNMVKKNIDSVIDKDTLIFDAQNLHD